MREPQEVFRPILPFPHVDNLIDSHGRRITYLRLAVTDRCNLRCRYCMPAKGIPFVPHDEILRYEEMARLISIFTDLGIRKLRLTGGEPFVRKGLLDFICSIKQQQKSIRIYLTTNGVAVAEHLHGLAELGISGLNMSLDSLDQERFRQITRRNYFDRAWQTFVKALDLGIPLKINTVLYDSIKTSEIIALAAITKRYPVIVRFIEQMPFNGLNRVSVGAMTARHAEKIIRKSFPGLESRGASGTAIRYQVPGFKGEIGFINGYSRRFCQTCDKVRITVQGMLKTCLYDNGRLDLKAMLRNRAGDAEMRAAVRKTVFKRAANGFAAEAEALSHEKHSMAAIGG